MKIFRRAVPDADIAFLDVISCGFGAIVLLLIISKLGVGGALEDVPDANSGLVIEMQEQLFELRGETQVLNRDLMNKQEQLSQYQQRIALLSVELESLEANSRKLLGEPGGERDQLRQALQSLTAEMERLLARQKHVSNQVIGGIPVDSEYIVFIIDTSGSMYKFAWSRVRREMLNILRIYPTVKGIQVMNDMGQYMFGSYRGRWIPDSEGRRQIIANTLQTWHPFSNSSPVEGIQQAIRTFAKDDKKISLYVFGDDFTGSSMASVLDTVERLNRGKKSGEQRVRIHTIGFPVHLLVQGGSAASATRFAHLMRELSYNNNGGFVGLNSLR
ncbi:MAG: hypothetical protein V7711_13595 [Pseudomonadales bacterium]